MCVHPRARSCLCMHRNHTALCVQVLLYSACIDACVHPYALVYALIVPMAALACVYALSTLCYVCVCCCTQPVSILVCTRARVCECTDCSCDGGVWPRKKLAMPFAQNHAEHAHGAGQAHRPSHLHHRPGEVLWRGARGTISFLYTVYRNLAVNHAITVYGVLPR